MLVGDNNILSDVLACRSAQCSYELWCILMSTWGESNPLTSVSKKTLKIITFLRILAEYKECQFSGTLLFLLRIPTYLHLPVCFAMKQFSYQKIYSLCIMCVCHSVFTFCHNMMPICHKIVIIVII